MTQQIQIRRYRADDVEALCEAVLESHSELQRWMPWCRADYGRDDAAEWVHSRPAAWERRDEFSFIVESIDGRLLGTCGLRRIDELNRCGELGYWIRTSATRQGIATVATRQLARWAFDEIGLHRIEIMASTENAASLRVAEKAGAVQEGILRQRLLLHGRWHDCVLSALVAS